MMRFCSRCFGRCVSKFRGLLPGRLCRPTSLPEGGSESESASDPLYSWFTRGRFIGETVPPIEINIFEIDFARGSVIKL